MKILRQAPQPKEWTRNLTCKGITVHGCESELQVEGTDIQVFKKKEYSDDPRDGGAPYEVAAYGFRCPVCSELTEVPAKDLPVLVRKHADRNRDLHEQLRDPRF